MTYKEAVKAEIAYPIKTSTVELQLIKKGFDPDDLFNGTSTEAYDLAVAACLMSLLAQPNLVEGGMQINLTEKNNIKDLVKNLYAKWGLEDPLDARPLIRSKKVW